MIWDTSRIAPVLDLMLKMIAIVGGAGGVAYWIDRWRNRVRLRARLLSVDGLFFQFEVENQGVIATSLPPTLIVRGYYPILIGEIVRAARISIPFRVGSPDRKLEPRKPYRSSAHLPDEYRNRSDIEKLLGGHLAEDNENQFFYPRYKFRPTGGHGHVLYGRRHSRALREVDALNSFRYWISVYRFVRRCRHIRDLTEHLSKIDPKFKASYELKRAAAQQGDAADSASRRS